MPDFTGMIDKGLFVFADFDFLRTTESVGSLVTQRVRGREVCAFRFEREWIDSHSDIVLDPALHFHTDMQYADEAKEVFRCFRDMLPDRWGRHIMDLSEQMSAQNQNRPVRHLSSLDRLLLTDDRMRIGGLRLFAEKGGDSVDMAGERELPTLSSLEDLIHASLEVELCYDRKTMPAERCVTALLRGGTSLGGARPKTSVVDEDGCLSIAKFPSRRDRYDVELWEHFAHLMARRCGIDAAITRVVGTTQSNYHVLLSRRFDRTSGTAAAGRRHFASALTMLGLSDGDNASTGHGYLDIVDFIVGGCCNVQYNLEELYRRVAFNIAIGNSDDHFRNHGFLLTEAGWTLSPAYDLNPSLLTSQSLLVNSYSDDSDLEMLLDSCEEYLLEKKKATRIIGEVLEGMKSWRKVASSLGLSRSEQDYFSGRFIMKQGQRV